jgi:hypothetical protein
MGGPCSRRVSPRSHREFVMTPLFERPFYAVGVACAFTLAVFAPTVFGRPDSFPLSTYPMFAQHRGQPKMTKLVALTAKGVVPVRPELLGTGEVLQAKVLLEQIAGESGAQRQKFCARTAERLSKLSETADWRELELVRVKYDPIDYFYNDARPVSEKVLTRCPVRAATEAPPARSVPRDAESSRSETHSHEEGAE